MPATQRSGVLISNPPHGSLRLPNIAVNRTRRHASAGGGAPITQSLGGNSTAHDHLHRSRLLATRHAAIRRQQIQSPSLLGVRWRCRGPGLLVSSCRSASILGRACRGSRGSFCRLTVELPYAVVSLHRRKAAVLSG